MPKKLILFFVLLLLLLGIVAAQPENIIVSEHSIMVHQIGKRATFRESMMFSNVGDDVFVGELVAALPSGAYNIIVTMPANDDNLTVIPYFQKGNNIYWDAKIGPHEAIQINVEYQSDVQPSGILQKQIAIEKELRYYTQVLSVVVITTAEADVIAPPLITMGPRTYNEEFDAYISSFTGSNLMPQKIALTLTEQGAIDLETTLFVGVICIVAALIAVPFLKGREIKLFKKEDAKTLEKKKVALLTVLNELDKDYKAKKINMVEYQDLKSKYEKEAIRVMKKLDKIKERH